MMDRKSFRPIEWSRLAKMVVESKLAALEFDVHPSRWKHNENTWKILMQTIGV